MARRAVLAACLTFTAIVGVTPAVGPVAGAAPDSTAELPISAPDRLAYSTETYTTYPDGGDGGTVHGLGTIGLDGSDQRVLTDPKSPAFDHSPQWSPDGTWLAFLRDNGDGSFEVAAIPRDGGDVQVVDPSGYGPAWSPDGLHLAWVSIHDDGTRSIAIVDVRTTATAINMTGRRDLPVPETTGWPTFSPDGQTLAFSVGSVPNDQAGVFTMPITGGDLQQVSHGVHLPSGEGKYSWSPDGSKLLFLADTHTDYSAPLVYVVNADGTDQHVVYPKPSSDTYAFAATWSPVGNAIAVATNANADGIAIVALDGLVLQRLAPNRLTDWGGLTFSPDGLRIYTVARPQTGGRPPDPPDLYAISVIGGIVDRLTTDQSVFPGTVQAMDPGRVLRQFGPTAAAAAVAASRDNFAKAATVVLARADAPLDALAAAPLAGKAHAPLLLTSRSALYFGVRQEIARLRARQVYAVGALSATVVSKLRATGLTVTRIGDSANPIVTAAAIARKVGTPWVVIVPGPARGAGRSALTLAAAGYAAARHQSILYAGPHRLPTNTRRALTALHAVHATIIGTRSWIGTAITRQLRARGIAVSRIASDNRYGVSAALAEHAIHSGVTANRLVIATGSSASAAMIAPALAGALGVVTVLANGKTLKDSVPTRRWLADHRRAIRTARLLGSASLVHPNVEAQLEHIL